MTTLSPQSAASDSTLAQPGKIVQPGPLKSTCSVSPEQLRAAEKVVAREVRRAQALYRPSAAGQLG